MYQLPVIFQDLRWMHKPFACKMLLGLRATFYVMQVPPDFYIPDFDEDEQNPDERMDRECHQNNNFSSLLWFALINAFLI